MSQMIQVNLQVNGFRLKVALTWTDRQDPSAIFDRKLINPRRSFKRLLRVRTPMLKSTEALLC